jgi:hypothetical protein
VQLDIISELSHQNLTENKIKEKKKKKISDYRKQLKYLLLKLVESVGILWFPAVSREWFSYLILLGSLVAMFGRLLVVN